MNAPATVPCGLALGSNVGDRLDNLRRAREAVTAILQAGALRSAPVYESAPVDCPDGSGKFLNTVIEIALEAAVADNPMGILTSTQEIEAALGRPAATGRVKNAPRAIDIDLLYIGGTQVDAPQLQVPHPRIASRRFVLTPLADLRPDLVLPGQDSTASALLVHLQSTEPELTLTAATW